MPAYYDIPLVGALGNQNFQVEDVDKFQKLPFYLVMNEVRRFPAYKTWDSLFGSIKWQTNMGSIMRGVTPNPSPDGTAFVFPANITSTPTRHVFETLENIEEARVKLQRFESKQFYFLPSWQDFRDNQLKFNHDDIIRQVALFNEKFIQGNAFYRAPNIYVAGNNGTAAIQFGISDFIPGVAFNDLPAADATGAAAIPANGKTADWCATVASITRDPLTLRHIYRACQFFSDDVGALPFEGTLNTPRDNELVKGKFVLIMGTDAWRRFTWDDSVDRLKNLQLDLLFDGFKGSLFGQITAKPIFNPLRMTNNGVFVAPQVTVAPSVGAGTEGNKTRPNPLYTKIDPQDNTVANLEWAFLCGADAWKTITVGPPPSEFTSRSMDAEKFYKLRWNGEIQLTDQCLIRYSDGSVDLNRYGTNLQLIGQAALGALAGEVNNILPICFRRTRIAATEITGS
jgi:hypothetical protein